MTDSEVLKKCTKFLAGHYPQSPKEYFEQMAQFTEADLEMDVYGQGKLINEFEAEIAHLMGKQAAVFMPSGIMAQQIALRIWASKSGTKNIAYHPTSHLEQDEHKASQLLHGLNSILIGHPAELIQLKDLVSISEKISTLLLELPQRRIGGMLPEWNDLLATREWADKKSCYMHLDGARLWESQPYYGKSYREICSLFDSVYLSFYKGLGGITGAMLLGDEEFINEAKIWQRRHGGNLYKLFPYVLNAKYVFQKRLSKMPIYHQKAKELAEVLIKFQNIEIKPFVPQTNMFHIFFKGNLESLFVAREKVALERKIWLFRNLVPSSLPNYFNAEIAIGDAALDISNEELKMAFEDFFKYVD